MELLGVSPGRRAAIYFLLTILLGTAVLLLPISEKGQPITLIDALFTSTSAVCVTGLTVLDTGKALALASARVMADPEILENVKREFEETMRKKA